jgi:antitoxin component YwqK of YwqJK toxin-antitoxin module
LVSCGNKISYDELTFKSRIAQYNGKPYTGSFFESFPNGDIEREGQFKDGLKVGKFTRYHENKKIREEDNYIIKDFAGETISVNHGVSKRLSENGIPEYIFNYNNGYKEGLQESFNSIGFKYLIENYKLGKLEGEKIEYQYGGPSGVLKFKCSYKSGKPDGEMIQYHSNGVVWRKAFFKEGKQEGVEEYFNSKGVLTERNVYKSGFKLESKTFEKSETPANDAFLDSIIVNAL